MASRKKPINSWWTDNLFSAVILVWIMTLTVFVTSVWLKKTGTTIEFGSVTDLQLHSIYFTIAGFTIGISFLTFLSVVNASIEKKKEEKENLDQEIEELKNELENVGKEIKEKRTEIRDEVTYKMKILSVVCPSTNDKIKTYLITDIHYKIREKNLILEQYEEELFYNFYKSSKKEGELKKFINKFESLFPEIIENYK